MRSCFLAVGLLACTSRHSFCQASITGRAWRQKRSPAGVGSRPWTVRVNSAQPSSCSSRWICWEMADWDT